jgi:hypothetical protein
MGTFEEQAVIIALPFSLGQDDVNFLPDQDVSLALQCEDAVNIHIKDYGDYHDIPMDIMYRESRRDDFCCALTPTTSCQTFAHIWCVPAVSLLHFTPTVCVETSTSIQCVCTSAHRAQCEPSSIRSPYLTIRRLNLRLTRAKALSSAGCKTSRKIS